MLLNNKVLAITVILLSVVALSLIFSKFKDIRWITAIIVLSFTIVYFSLTFIFDLGEDMYILYKNVDCNFKYADALNATIAILTLLGTGLSIILTKFFKDTTNQKINNKKTNK